MTSEKLTKGFTTNALFSWEKNELATPKVTKDHITDLIHAALALPYKGIWDADNQAYIVEEERFENATNAEVAVIKLVESAARTGDDKLIKEVLDRTLGKPKQAVESVSMTMSYEDFLEQSARERLVEQQTDIDRDLEDL